MLKTWLHWGSKISGFSYENPMKSYENPDSFNSQLKTEIKNNQ